MPRRPKEGLPRGARVRRSREIEALFKEGRRVRTPLIDVLALVRSRTGPSGRPIGRVGFVVPKLGEGIVARNRLKRRLREIGRRRVLQRLQEAGVDADVLVRAKRKAYRATYGQLEDAVMGVVEEICSARR